MKGGIENKPIIFTTKVAMPMQAPLSFAVPR
jgi:hypothetical protein